MRTTNKIDVLLSLADVIQDICIEAERTMDSTEVDTFFSTYIESVDTSDIDYLGIWGGHTLSQQIGADKYGY